MNFFSRLYPYNYILSSFTCLRTASRRRLELKVINRCAENMSLDNQIVLMVLCAARVHSEALDTSFLKHKPGLSISPIEIGAVSQSYVCILEIMLYIRAYIWLKSLYANGQGEIKLCLAKINTVRKPDTVTISSLQVIITTCKEYHITTSTAQ